MPLSSRDWTNCNCLLFGIPKYQRDKLQRIQNTAARLVMGLKRSDHVTPILKNLHWLPVQKRIEFKILVVTYKTIHDQSADYLKPLIEMYQLPRTLRSASHSLLCVELFLLWHRNCGTPYRRTLRMPRL